MFLPTMAMFAVCLCPVAARAQPPSAQHYQVARSAFLEGNVDKADLEVRLALQDNPDDADSRFLLGCLLDRRGENDQATVGFQRALPIDPTSPEVLYNLGTMLLRRGEVVLASRLLENTVLVRPDRVPSYTNLGKAYFLAGLTELAVGACEEVLRRDPSNAVALRNLLLLAEPAGLRDAAASYRRRLEVVGSGRAGKHAPDTGAPGAPNPTWPLAPDATGSPCSAGRAVHVRSRC